MRTTTLLALTAIAGVTACQAKHADWPEPPPPEAAPPSKNAPPEASEEKEPTREQQARAELLARHARRPQTSAPAEAASEARERAIDEAGHKLALQQLTVGCWTRKVAEDCSRLGTAYFGVNGFTYDAQAGERAYAEGCRLGSSFACLDLGSRLANGRDLAEDKARAAALNERACSLGNEHGCAVAAFAVWNGDLEAPDQRKAVGLWTASCNRGGGLSCGMLGELAVGGALGTAAQATGRDLIVRACRLGEKSACARVNQLR